MNAKEKQAPAELAFVFLASLANEYPAPAGWEARSADS